MVENFIFKIRSDGTAMYGNLISPLGANGDLDRVPQIVVDNDKNITIFGLFMTFVAAHLFPRVRGSSIWPDGFANTLAADYNTANQNLVKNYVFKYNNNGIPIWGQMFGGLIEGFLGARGNITSDKNNDLYITRYFAGIDMIYYGSQMFPIPAGIGVFIGKISSGGELLWGQYVSTNANFPGAAITGVAVNGDKDVIICSSFVTNTIITDPPLIELNNAPNMFFAKLSQDRFGQTIGILNEPVGLGGFATATFTGESSSSTGLIPGDNYYIDDGGQLTLQSLFNPHFGTSSSSTNLVLTRRYPQ